MDYTPVNHNIETTYILLCRFPPCVTKTALTCQSMDGWCVSTTNVRTGPSGFPAEIRWLTSPVGVLVLWLISVLTFLPYSPVYITHSADFDWLHCSSVWPMTITLTYFPVRHVAACSWCDLQVTWLQSRYRFISPEFSPVDTPLFSLSLPGTPLCDQLSAFPVNLSGRSCARC